MFLGSSDAVLSVAIMAMQEGCPLAELYADYHQRLLLEAYLVNLFDRWAADLEQLNSEMV